VAQQCKWWHASRSAGLGGASSHFIPTFEKRVFQQNLGQNMPKNARFLEKRL